MDLAARRALLETAANPDGRLDYVSALSGRIDWAGTAVSVRLLYVPDRIILKPEAFPGYLAALGAGPADTLEAVAATLLEDVNNELVPRWIQACATRPTGDGSHAVLLEDRQPKWDNPPLLAQVRAGIPIPAV